MQSLDGDLRSSSAIWPFGVDPRSPRRQSVGSTATGPFAIGVVRWLAFIRGLRPYGPSWAHLAGIPQPLDKPGAPVVTALRGLPSILGAESPLGRREVLADDHRQPMMTGQPIELPDHGDSGVGLP
ncbi:MAG: hypothetical protein M3256_22475 [Actinomycetota bacterium]|nr:hypothetical protein [Actinomycetota bacterium]